jgi:hypothetical protein
MSNIITLIANFHPLTPLQQHIKVRVLIIQLKTRSEGSWYAHVGRAKLHKAFTKEY